MDPYPYYMDPTGCDLPKKKAWVNLNRMRTAVGRTTYFLTFFGYFASSNPPLPESSSHHFFSCIYMAAISNLKMADLYRDRKIN